MGSAPSTSPASNLLAFPSRAPRDRQAPATGGAAVVALALPELSKLDRDLLVKVAALEERRRDRSRAGWDARDLAREEGIVSLLLPPLRPCPRDTWDGGPRPKDRAARAAWREAARVARRAHDAEEQAWYRERMEREAEALSRLAAIVRRWIGLGVAERAEGRGRRCLTARGRRLAGVEMGAAGASPALPPDPRAELAARGMLAVQGFVIRTDLDTAADLVADLERRLAEVGT